MSGALAGSGGDAANAATGTTIQYEAPEGQAPEGTPDRTAPEGAPDGPCPEDESGNEGSQGSGTSASASADSVAL